MIKKNILFFILFSSMTIHAFTPGLQFLDLLSETQPNTHVTGDTISSFLYNPASVAVSTYSSLSLTHINLFENTKYDTIMASIPLSSFSIGGLVGYHSLGDFTIKNFTQPEQTLQIYHIISALNLSFPVFTKIYFGMNINSVYSHYSTEYKNLTILADFGCLYKFSFLRYYPILEDNMTLGLSVTHLGPQFLYDPLFTIPYTIKAGLQYKPLIFLDMVFQVEKNSAFFLSSGIQIKPFSFLSFLGNAKYGQTQIQYSLGFQFLVPVHRWDMNIWGGWKQLDIDNSLYFGINLQKSDKQIKILQSQEKIHKRNVSFQKDHRPVITVNIIKTKNSSFNAILHKVLKTTPYIIQDKDANYYLTFNLSKSNSLFLLKAFIIDITKSQILKSYKIKFKSRKAWKNIILKIFEKTFTSIEQTKQNESYVSINTFDKKYILLVDHNERYKQQCLIEGESESFYQIYKNSIEHNNLIFETWITITNQNVSLNLPFHYKDNLHNINFNFWNTITNQILISHSLYAHNFKTKIKITTTTNNNFIFGIVDKKGQTLFFNTKDQYLYAKTTKMSTTYNIKWKKNTIHSLSLLYKDGVASFYINDIVLSSFPIDLSLFHKILLTKTNSIKYFQYSILQLH